VEDLAQWMDEMGQWTISRALESGEWTAEAVVADWVISGDRIAFLPIFAEDPHLLTVTHLEPEPDGDGWKVDASGQRFSVGLVWTDQQWADLKKWQAERPAVVPTALAELAG
jgi:hypothetical protein